MIKLAVIKVQIGLIIFTAIYLLVVLFTNISLIGYWTDVIFSFLLATITLVIVFKQKAEKSWLTIGLRLLAILFATVVYGMLGLNLINPYAWNTFKIKSFYGLNVDQRVFNAYFKPVGAYSGGEGNFWIAESYKYFPIIEVERYYEHAILWNFRESEFDGQLINQEEIAKTYIRDKILKKEE